MARKQVNGETGTSAERRRTPIWRNIVVAGVCAFAVFAIAYLLLSVVLVAGSSGPQAQPGQSNPRPLPSAVSSPVVEEPRLTRAERLDVVRIALTVVAGVGGIVALVVAYRRQVVAEEEQARQALVDQNNEHDARERRITELYTQAISQIASDRSPVRVGGMYALERLAQEHLAHRQSVVNVLCAYLRTPISLTDREIEALSMFGREEPEHDEDVPSVVGSEQSTIEELHARLAAQRILIKHFRKDGEGKWPPDRESGRVPSNANYWPGIQLDLSDTQLIEFDASSCYFEQSDFRRAVFQGVARFSGSYFATGVQFDYAVFDKALFDWAEFAAHARFFSVKFGRWAGFDQTKFGTESTFNAARFSGVAAFRGSKWVDGTDSFLLLGAAAHVNLRYRGVREWPPGWRVRVRSAYPNVGELELTAYAESLIDGEFVDRGPGSEVPVDEALSGDSRDTASDDTRGT